MIQTKAFIEFHKSNLMFCSLVEEGREQTGKVDILITFEDWFTFTYFIQQHFVQQKSRFDY